MTAVELKRRTQRFAVSAIRLVERLPRTRAGDVLGRQFIRSATSVGANYRAACRGRSGAEFIARMGVVEEEADESVYWLELMIEAQLVSAEDVAELLDEANQLVAIAVASIRTARGSTARPRSDGAAPRTPAKATID